MMATTRQATDIMDRTLGLAPGTTRTHTDRLRAARLLPCTKGTPTALTPGETALLLVSVLSGSAANPAITADALAMRGEADWSLGEALAQFFGRPDDLLELRLDLSAPAATVTYRSADGGIRIDHFASPRRYARPAFKRVAIVDANTWTSLAIAISAAPPVHVGRRRQADKFNRRARAA
jgi:hypothetical protein